MSADENTCTVCGQSQISDHPSLQTQDSSSAPDRNGWNPKIVVAICCGAVLTCLLLILIIVAVLSWGGNENDVAQGGATAVPHQDDGTPASSRHASSPRQAAQMAENEGRPLHEILVAWQKCLDEGEKADKEEAKKRIVALVESNLSKWVPVAAETYMESYGNRPNEFLAYVCINPRWPEGRDPFFYPDGFLSTGDIFLRVPPPGDEVHQILVTLAWRLGRIPVSIRNLSGVNKHWQAYGVPGHIKEVRGWVPRFVVEYKTQELDKRLVMHEQAKPIDAVGPTEWQFRGLVQQWTPGDPSPKLDYQKLYGERGFISLESVGFATKDLRLARQLRVNAEITLRRGDRDEVLWRQQTPLRGV